MPTFKVNDRVRWVRAASSLETKDAVGVVTKVIPNDTAADDFNMHVYDIKFPFGTYDIKFPFGTFTLYGTQIEADAE